MTDAVRRVLRTDWPGGSELIEIETAANVIVTVYVSRTGRSVRVFRRRKGKQGIEMKAASP